MLRFPEGMRQRIKEAAESNGRTMNAEIVARLQESFLSVQREVAITSDVASAMLKALDRANQHAVLLAHRLENLEQKLDRDQHATPTRSPDRKTK
jgi:hypothetical protein